MAPDDNEDNKQEESLSEDEEANRLVERRASVNIDNVIGLDFERYNVKASQTMKLKIKNLVEEYVMVGDN